MKPGKWCHMEQERCPWCYCEPRSLPPLTTILVQVEDMVHAAESIVFGQTAVPGHGSAGCCRAAGYQPHTQGGVAPATLGRAAVGVAFG